MADEDRLPVLSTLKLGPQVYKLGNANTVGAYIDENLHLILEIDDGKTLDGGRVPYVVQAYDDTQVRDLIGSNSDEIASLAERVQTAIDIAEGSSAGYVFPTVAALDEALEDEEFVSKLKVGDNLYIIDLEASDYWWDGTQKQPLRTESVDLEEYAKKDELVSSTPENAIEKKDDGLFVPKPEEFVLPKATESTLGGIKVGNNLSMRPDGTLDANVPEGGGGTGGTYDYVDLNNKPSINDIPLVANKTAEELGLKEVAVDDTAPTDYKPALWLDTSADEAAQMRPQALVSFDDYSEEEKIVGKWMDGRPIYRRVVSGINSSPVKANTRIAFTTNVEFDVDVEPVNFGGKIKVLESSASWNIGVTKSVGSLSLAASLSPEYWFSLNKLDSIENTLIINYLETTGASKIQYDYVVDYVKSTDSPNSFDPNMIQHHPVDRQFLVSDFDDYSENEIVVGRWIDGKPLYRKVLTLDSPIQVGAKINAWTTITDQNIPTDADYFRVVDTLHNEDGVYASRKTNANFKITLLSGFTGLRLAYFYEAEKVRQYSTINVFILEYTKSTDLPNSFNPNMLTTAAWRSIPTDADVEEVFNYE